MDQVSEQASKQNSIDQKYNYKTGVVRHEPIIQQRTLRYQVTGITVTSV